MPSYWPLLLGAALLIALVLVVKRLFPGIGYASLRKLKLNADAISSVPLLTLSIDRSGNILEVHSVPAGFSFNFHNKGKNWCEFIHKDLHENFMSAVENAFISGIPKSFQYSLTADSGQRWHYCEIVKTAEATLLLTVRDNSISKLTAEKLSMAFRSEDMTTFILDTDSGTVTFDREDFVSKWAGRIVPKVAKLDSILSLVSQSDRERLVEALKQVTSGVEHVHVVKVKIARDNYSAPKWISVRGYAVPCRTNSSKSIFIGVVRDITGAVRAEEQLKNLNLMLKNVLDTVPVGLYWKDANLKYRGASRVFLKDIGLVSEEFLDDNLWFTERSRQIEQQIVATGRSVLNRQETLQLPGGRELRINISRVPLRSQSGEIIGLMVAYVDVTENIKFRDQLIRRKEFLSGLVDNLPVGFFAKDPATGMTYRIWNREMEQIFGFTASEAVEQRDWNLFGTKAAALMKKDDDALLADPDSGKTPRIYELPGRNGLRTVSVVRVLLYDDLLDSNLVAGVVDDITRESELEDQLRQAHKMEAIGRLAGGVAHDFNNLLQVMMGSAEIGTSGTVNAEKSFNQILEAGEKAMFLTRQLLSFSRDESFSRRVFSVDHRVGEFIRMVHRIIGENAKLEFISGAPEAKINGDPFQLEQVLMNLLVNAKDAIPHGRDGSINVVSSTSKVSCFAGGEPVECVIISVTDTGEGIPPEIIDKIFEPFFTTKAQGKGTGLGLASSYGIVAKHDGIIQVESIPGEGTRFNVCIPLCSESLEKLDEKKSEDVPDRSFVPLKILLAEDDEMVREIARTILESAGHSIVEAKDGGDAVKLFMENRDFFDLLVFDAIMPVMNGSEAFMRIHAEAPDIPVLFCTGYSRDTLVGAFSDTEKAGVLQKPYAAADLLEAVKSLTQDNL